ncbi:MAG: aminotransferase class I/II-fold pyridoxal phosphate-dependent enzyme, partial [Dactylosporangium sp.]|nr:aminotransferase class I/II-fold pyridoxal phosphate-dependent enzyme [Dactylosporangium sp.]
TALPPAVVAGVRTALGLARAADDRRAELAARVRLLASLGASAAPAGGVVSLTAGSAQAAVDWAAACRERGVAVGCFRPPSTPDNQSRLRLTVNVGVPRADFEYALDVVAESRRG